MYLVISGNPVDGLSFIGPFESADDAVLYAENEYQEWWVHELEQPKGRDDVE